MPDTPRRVREPVQAYLAADDSQLLAALSEQLSLSKAEVIRLGIRRLAQELELAQRPGVGVAALVGSLDGAPDVPSDLASRHDDYLYVDSRTASAPLRRVSDATAEQATAEEAAAGTTARKRHARNTRRG